MTTQRAPHPPHRRFRFLYREGDTYVWESRGRLPGDSRVQQVSCCRSWFWTSGATA